MKRTIIEHLLYELWVSEEFVGYGINFIASNYLKEQKIIAILQSTPGVNWGN